MAEMQYFKDCYIEAKLTINTTEVFVDGKIVFINHPVKVATLHAQQANDITKLNRIKQMMLDDLMEANHWSAIDNKQLKYSFTLAIMPRKYKPISYHI